MSINIYIYIFISLYYLFARARTRLVSSRGIPTRIHDVTSKHGNFLKFSDSRSLSAFKDSYGKRIYYTLSILYDLKILESRKRLTVRERVAFAKNRIEDSEG